MRSGDDPRLARYLAAQFTVAGVLARAPDLNEALPRVLRVLCESLPCEWAALWMVDQHAGVLGCAEIWPAGASATAELEALSRRTTIAPRVELPGRVWSSGASLWTTDVARDADGPRALVAAGADLHAAFGVPIACRGEIFGVMEFFRREVGAPDEDLLAMVSAVGSQIGLFIAHVRAEAARQQSEARTAGILAAALDSIITIDHQGWILDLNPAAERTFGFRREDVLGLELAETIIPLRLREAHRRGLEHYLSSGEGPVLGQRVEMPALRADGSEFPVELAITVITSDGPPVFTAYLRDITERRGAGLAAAEREQLAAFGAAVGQALTRGASLRDSLQRTAEAMVRHLDAAFARVWTLNEAEQVLELQASAGLYTHLDGPHGRISIGQYKIGLIAQERQPHLTNQVIGDQRVSDQEWARREGLVAFAGYPLLVGDQLVGVMALFARRSLSNLVLDALASVADSVAVEIRRRSAEDALRRQTNLLDQADEALLVWEVGGTIIAWNRGAERLYGFSRTEAIGQPSHRLLRTGPPERLAAFLAALELNGHWEGELVHVARAGQTVPVETRAVVVLGDGQRSVVEANRDITERRRAEAERARLFEAEQAARADAEAARERFAFLARASATLAGSLDEEATLATLAQLAVPALADWCVVDIVEEGRPRRVAVVHGDPVKLKLADELKRRYPADPKASYGVPEVLRTGRPELVEEIPPSLLEGAARDAEHLRILRSLGLRSYMIAPFVASGQTLGAITFVASESGRRFGLADLSLAEELAGRAALALENARLYREAREQAAVHVELNAALRETVEERDQALAAAEAERGRLRELFEQAPAAIAVLRGPTHVFETANPRYVQLAGRRDLVGRTAREVFPELAGQGFLELLDQVYESGEPFIGTELPVTLDPHAAGGLAEGFFNFVYQPVRRPDAQVEGIFVHAVEVSEQVRARQRVEALAAERQAILAQLTEGVVVADAEGRVIFVNQAAARLHATADGDRPTETEGKGYQLLTLGGEPYPPEELPLLRAARLGETVTNARWRIQRPDALEIVVEGSAAPVWGEDATRLGSVLVLRDVTAEVELDRQKDEFLASASHDLKNPLGALLGTAQLLRRRIERGGGTVDGERAAASLAAIETAARQLATQVDRLLDVARARMGRPLDLQRADTDLVALAQKAAAAYQATTERHRLRVLSTEADLVGAWDSERLERLLGNLLGNAVKYSPNGGEITMRVWREDGWAVLSVTDSGVGIPEADLPRVFERFVRAANVASSFEGTGIGLSDVAQIVRQHGGTVDVESHVGEGSTFTVRLPLEPPNPPLDAPEGSRGE